MVNYRNRETNLLCTIFAQNFNQSKAFLKLLCYTDFSKPTDEILQWIETHGGDLFLL